MKRYLVWCGVVLLAISPVRAREARRPRRSSSTCGTPPTSTAPRWAISTSPSKRLERDGQKIFHTTKLMHLTLKRYDGVITQRMAMTTDETADGKVVGVSMTHYLDKGRKVVQSGRVEGDKLIVTTPSDPDGRAVPWKDGVIGFYGQELIFQIAQGQVRRPFSLPRLPTAASECGAHAGCNQGAGGDGLARDSQRGRRGARRSACGNVCCAPKSSRKRSPSARTPSPCRD